ESDELNMEPMEIHCVDVDTPVLTRDLRWVRAGDVEEGDVLLGFDENPRPESAPQNPIRNIAEAHVSYTEPADVHGYVVHLSNGEKLRCTGEHQFIIEQPLYGRSWRHVSDIYNELYNRHVAGMRPKFFLPKFIETWDTRADHEAGRLAGKFDAEIILSGNDMRRRRTPLTDRMVEGLLADFPEVYREKQFGHYRVDAYLPEPYNLAFEADGEYWHNEKGRDEKRDKHLFEEFGLRVIHISEAEVNSALSFDKVPIRGGLHEVMRFIGSIRPDIALRWWELQDISTKTIMGSGKGAVEKPQIVKITREKMRVAQITTSCQTYFTAGYASHNSGRAGGIIEHAGGLLMARPSFHAEPPTQNTEDARTAEQ
ncbi:hypothetical protein LCGC14_2984490, partial [marine sediment metagenome]